MLTNKQKWRKLICYQTPKKDSSIDMIEKSSKSSRISYCRKDRVILIPSIIDYRKRGLHEELWWQPSELADFKNDALREIIAVMKGQGLDAKAAISYLYHQITDAVNDTMGSSLSSDREDIITEENIDIEFLADVEPRIFTKSISFEQTQTHQYIHPLALLAS